MYEIFDTEKTPRQYDSLSPNSILKKVTDGYPKIPFVTIRRYKKYFDGSKYRCFEIQLFETDVNKPTSMHTIRLKHGTFTGLRKIYVNDVLIIKEYKFFDNGSEHILDIANRKFKLIIATNFYKYKYYLDPLP